MENNKLGICSKHVDSKIDCICYVCSELFCSGCLRTSHGKHVEDCRHISEIKLDLCFNINGNTENDASKNGYSNNKFTKRIEILWKSILSIAEKLKSFSSIENEIIQKYKEFYDFIMAEELNVKKPIIKQSNILNEVLNTYYKELHSLLNLNYINSTISKKDNNKEAAILDIEEDIGIISESKSNNIIDLINASHSNLDNLINILSHSFFNSNNNMVDYKNNGLDNDLILLTHVNNFNQEYGSALSKIIEEPKPEDFKIVVDNLKVEKFVKRIQQSVRVLTGEDQLDYQLEEDLLREKKNSKIRESIQIEYEAIEKKLLDLDNEILIKDKNVKQKDIELKEIDHQQSERENKLNIRDIELNDRENKINDKENQLNNRENQILIKENQIKTIEYQQINAEKQVKERENKVIIKENQQNDREKKQNYIENQLNDRKNNVIIIENKLNDRNNEINKKEMLLE